MPNISDKFTCQGLIYHYKTIRRPQFSVISHLVSGKLCYYYCCCCYDYYEYCYYYYYYYDDDDNYYYYHYSYSAK